MSALTRICGALEQAGVHYAVVGGYAVALHGAVRGTVDIDIVLSWTRKSLFGAEEALTGIGLVSRLPITAGDVLEFRNEYVQNRNLVAWNFYNPHDLSEQLDIVITYDLKGRRRKRIDLENTSIYILSKPDLIKMKRQSGRPQDREDVMALESLR